MYYIYCHNDFQAQPVLIFSKLVEVLKISFSLSVCLLGLLYHHEKLLYKKNGKRTITLPGSRNQFGLSSDIDYNSETKSTRQYKDRKHGQDRIGWITLFIIFIFIIYITITINYNINDNHAFKGVRGCTELLAEYPMSNFMCPYPFESHKIRIWIRMKSYFCQTLKSGIRYLPILKTENSLLLDYTIFYAFIYCQKKVS